MNHIYHAREDPRDQPEVGRIGITHGAHSCLSPATTEAF